MHITNTPCLLGINPSSKPWIKLTQLVALVALIIARECILPSSRLDHFLLVLEII